MYQKYKYQMYKMTIAKVLYNNSDTELDIQTEISSLTAAVCDQLAD